MNLRASGRGSVGPSISFAIRYGILSALGAALTALIITLTPTPARACSCLAQAISRSVPADGATDVARNVAITFDGHFDPESVELKTEAGEAVDFELSAAPGFIGTCYGDSGELIPSTPLDANTTYVLTAVSEYEGMQTLTFTTGDEMIPETELSVPSIDFAILYGNPNGDSCLGDTQTCFGKSDELESLEVIARKGDATIARALLTARELREPQETFFYSVAEEPDCIEARRRDAAGRRSSPRTLCGDELPRREATLDDYRDCIADAVDPEPIDAGMEDGSMQDTSTWDSGAEPTRGAEEPRSASKASSSCSIASPSRARPGASLPWMLAAALACLRFSSRRRAAGR